LLQTIRDLKSELQSVKEDNERILKAQEKLNHILLSKIHNQENEKLKEPEYDGGTITCKCKNKKLDFLIVRVIHQVIKMLSYIKKNILILVRTVTASPRKKHINPMKKFQESSGR